MDYNELYNKYLKLVEENQILRIENMDFRKQLELQTKEICMDNEYKAIVEIKDVISIQKDKLSEVSNSSFPQEKVELYMTLFKGRKDVHAKRWQNKQGKSGYSPVCANEWAKGICDKPQIKCSACKNRMYTDLDADAINRHLRGIEILGIYAMQKDETCYFLAIDFDDDGWEKDIYVLREICDEKKIPFAVERSRSGNGAHIWFFFMERITALAARKFGTSLLTYAMMQRHEIKFKSYDRLFPNQDTMPKGGLGNLIALPMQKSARKNNNSIFIDENLEPFTDQWSFLSHIGKITKEEIDFYTSEFCVGNELGDLKETDEENIKPWEKNKENYKFSKADFPDIVQITIANMIFISKERFSNKALDFIKRMAAFKNPEFYKAQAMRLSTFDKPRVISLSDETTEYLCIPRGCENDLCSFLTENKIKISCDDKTYIGKPICVEFNGKLREEQIVAVDTMLKYDNGVLSATTAFGKTVIGAKLIAERKVNTLIIVHTQQLLEQWKEKLKQFLIINEALPIDDTKKRGRKKNVSIIGQIGAGKNILSGTIDVATMQSLVRKGEVKELVKDYGMIIIDECHHVSAFSFEQILKNVVAKYVYGLTATPIRKDGHQPIIFMQCGPIRYKVNVLKQTEKLPFEHYVIPRFTSFRKPVLQDEKEWSITKIYSEISTSEIRNAMIIQDVINCVKEGRNPIVLTERTAHVKLLSDALKEKIANVITLTGGMSKKEKKSQIEKLSGVPKEDSMVIVATGKFIGEGFDEPRLDTLFLAMPISWKGTLQQYSGRLNRLYENKNEVQIYDYIDVHVGVLERMYQKRLSGYAQIGYSAKTDSTPLETINSIYNNDNFLTVFSNDILLAKNEVVIVSQFLLIKTKFFNIIELLSNISKNGITVNIFTSEETDVKENEGADLKDTYDYLRTTGINIILKSNIHQKFIIIDQKTVWYGNINFLSYKSEDENIMRLTSLNIANELMDTIEDKTTNQKLEIAIQQKLF